MRPRVLRQDALRRSDLFPLRGRDDAHHPSPTGVNNGYRIRNRMVRRDLARAGAATAATGATTGHAIVHESVGAALRAWHPRCAEARLSLAWRTAASPARTLGVQR